MKEQGDYVRLSTEMDYRKRINQAMVFVRENVDRDLSIDEVAAAASFSPFHFHRIFKAFVGETLGDYMNRTRMIRAAGLMSEGMNVSEAAAGVDFKTTSSFIRAFKKTFNTLPSVFKQQETDQIKYIPRPALNSVDGTLIPEFRNLPNLNLWVIGKKGKLNGNFTRVAGEAFDELYQNLQKEGLMDQISMRFGILKDFDLINSKECRYEACVVIPQKTKNPAPPVKKGLINAGKWAVFTHKGPYDTLWQTWNKIYNSWYPVSGIEPADADPFEVYLNDKRYTDPSDLLTEIHIPIDNK